MEDVKVPFDLNRLDDYLKTNPVNEWDNPDENRIFNIYKEKA